MNIYKAFQTDTTAEIEGKYFNIDGLGDAEFLLAYQGNPEFKRLNAELLRPYRVEISTGTLSQEKQDEILIECFSKKIVLGWKNVEDDAGNPLEYSPDKAAELLTALPHLLKRIYALSVNWENFRVADKELAIKN